MRQTVLAILASFICTLCVGIGHQEQVNAVD